MLTPDDIKFINDRKSYSGGPVFEMNWIPQRPSDVPAILEALLRDFSIDGSLPKGDGSTDEVWDRRVTWFPVELRPVGMTLLEVDSDPVLPLLAYVYPPHFERCTGQWTSHPENVRDPQILTFFRAAVELTNRIHSVVPLAQAGLGHDGDEPVDYESADPGIIMLRRYVLDAARWPYSIPTFKEGNRAQYSGSILLGWDPPGDV